MIDPIREYDDTLIADKEHIDALPDIQNGPSGTINGSDIHIEQVGIHHFRLPIKYEVKNGDLIELETSVTGTVSLEACKKGINMSRIIRSFYEYKDENINLDKVHSILKTYKQTLDTFDARILLNFSYPMVQKSLRSNLDGYQYYNVTLDGHLDRKNNYIKIIHFDFVYSSACPCSYELSMHALNTRNRAVVPHSQRSVARVSVKYDDKIWLEDIHNICINALKTETLTICKREDEGAYAELNGANLKFVEDALRLLHAELNSDNRILDFKVIASHQESLHNHDAIGCIIKGMAGGFSSHVSKEEWSSLIHHH